MKIPRYQIKGGNVQSGTQLNSNLAAGDGFKKIGQEITNSSKSLAAADIKQTGLFRKLDITGKTAKAKGILTEVASTFLKDTDKMDQENPESWENNYVGAMTSAHEAVKKLYEGDDVVQMYIDADYLEVNTAYGLKLDKEIKNTKINNASFSFFKEKDDYQTNLNSALTTSEVKTLNSTYKDRVLVPYKGLLISDKDFKESSVAVDNQATLQIMKIESGVNKTKLAPNGLANDTDYASMLQNLTNKDFPMKDINGKDLPVDHPMRQMLIKNTKENLEEQLTIYKKQEISLTLTTNNDIKNDLVKYNNTLDVNERLTMKAEMMNKIKSLPESLGDTKLALTKLVNTETTNAATLASANPKVFQFFLLRAQNKIIDTPAEFDLVQKAWQKNLITKEQYQEIFTAYKTTKSDVDKKEKEYKNLAFKNIQEAVGGKGNVGIVLGDDGQVNLKFALALKQASLLSDAEYKAFSQMQRLLTVGRTKGFTVEEMLFDETSPAYIVQKIKDYAKEEKYKEKNQVYPDLKGDFKFTSEPLSQYQGIGTEQEPKKINETIEEYVERVGGF